MKLGFTYRLYPTKNHYLSKSISDQGWSTFIHFLTYKSLLKGGQTINVDRFYPSSKTCSGCGNVRDISLSDRTYECLECDMEMDRDTNAAINILNQGLKSLASGTGVMCLALQSQAGTACGGTTSGV